VIDDGTDYQVPLTCLFLFGGLNLPCRTSEADEAPCPPTPRFSQLGVGISELPENAPKKTLLESM
jgi:hypothetical protein